MASRTGGSGRYDAVQYPWLLTADPPVCRSGPALGVLRRCERLRRGDRCICRFAAADIAYYSAHIKPPLQLFSIAPSTILPPLVGGS